MVEFSVSKVENVVAFARHLHVEQITGPGYNGTISIMNHPSNLRYDNNPVLMVSDQPSYLLQSQILTRKLPLFRFHSSEQSKIFVLTHTHTRTRMCPRAHTPSCRQSRHEESKCIGSL